jgi:hypothetical protein
MTIEQTVEIPVDRRVLLEFLVPQELPVGKAKVELTLIPVVDTPPITGVWVNPLKGLCKGSKLTLARFMEMQRKDKKQEDEIDLRQKAESEKYRRGINDT